MKSALRSVLCFALAASVSCVTHRTELYGIGYTETRAFAGDGSAANTLMGDSIVYKNSTATSILANMFVSLVGAWAAADAYAAKQITDQMAAAGATKVQITNATLAAQNEAARIGAGVTGAGIQGKLFKEGATIFAQPKL